jgi:tetratricopeptide (TPR) repeat protein
MGAMESRAGDLTKARPLLQKAVEAKPTPPSLRLLAAIDRQQGRLPEALGSLTQMLALVRQQGDASQEAATQVMIYDLLRASGKQEQAATALSVALERALFARKNARTGPALAAVERVLADILERYGDAAGAKRAVQRAGDAARNDVWQLTATYLDATRRALSMGDLEAGREALRGAIDADLADTDLVYAALWVKLLHQRVGKPSDGSVEEALARIDQDGTWTAALRDWGKGQLTSEQLIARASTRVEKVEAEFYAALSAHFVSASKATEQRLEKVATSEAIELVEVRIARDFVNPASQAPKPSIPAGVTIP